MLSVSEKRAVVVFTFQNKAISNRVQSSKTLTRVVFTFQNKAISNHSEET